MKRPQNLRDRVIDLTGFIALSFVVPVLAVGIAGRIAVRIFSLAVREAVDMGREALTRETHGAVTKSNPKYQVN